MSKNLEEELKAYVEEIKPDLWNRIESQLPESQNTGKDTSIKVFPQQQKQDKVVKKPIHFFKKYGGMIAACVAIAVLAPIFANLKNQDASILGANKIANKTETSENVNDQLEEEMIFDVNETDLDAVYNIVATLVSIDEGRIVLQVVSSEGTELTEGEEIICDNPGFMFQEQENYQCKISALEDGTYHIMSVQVQY